MCKIVRVVLSTREEDNRKADELLSQLRGIEIRKTRDGQGFLDVMQLPFILTDEGSRYFGLEGVKDLVEKELTR